MSTPPTKLFYEFGTFRLDTEKLRLLRNGEIVALTPKAVEILRVLIEHRGQLVERQDLMNSVWGKVAVEDGNLTVTISMLRKALGEDINGRRFVETVPRLGYKFVAEVSETFETVPALVIERQTVGRVVVEEEFGLRSNFNRVVSRLFSSRRKTATAIGLALVLALSIGAFVYFSRSNSVGRQSAGVKSIAVLPFKQITVGDNAHQGLGLADILITRLSNLKQINVRPTSAVLPFENTQESSATIGQRLLVDAVLEGSILQVNDQVRVTARLIRVSDQSPIWAGHFVKPSQNELQLQDEIALQVVNALALNLSGAEEKALTKRYTQNRDAYQLYINGRYHWNKRNDEGLAEAQRLFRNAIQKDPNFALAYVGLADSLLFMQDSAELHSALAKAVELDPGMAEALATRGFVLGVHEWRWNEAEQEFRKSIEINPGYATAHHWYAILLGIEGRNEEAKDEMRRALEIDPMSPNFLADLGQVHYFNREYDKAKEFCNNALAVYPDFIYAHEYLYAIYMQTGEYESGIDELVRLTSPAGSKDTISVEPARHHKGDQYRGIYRMGGIKKFLEFRLVQSSQIAGPNRYFGEAYNHALLGNKKEALDSLESAFEQGSFMMAWAKAEPAFDSLRSERRFREILQKMNLPPDQ